MADKEEGLEIKSVVSYDISFWIGDKRIGKLFWDDGVMEFEGKAKKSAERLFGFLRPYVDDYIRGKLNG